MCEAGPWRAPAQGPPLSRRRLLQGLVAVAALSACDSAPPRGALPAQGPLPPQALRAYSLAMHIHASTSEGTGSVRAQLGQASANGFDAVWFTEHDWRRDRLLYRRSYSFTPDEYALGGSWTLEPVQSSGDLRSGDGRFVTDPVSPNDPAGVKGSLRLTATGAGDQPATAGQRVQAEGSSRENFRTRIAGRSVSVDVLPEQSGPDAWGQVRFLLSLHPASGARPEGIVSIVYRLRPDVRIKEVSAEGTTAYVDVPIEVGRWQTVGFDLTGDVALAWPDLDPRDNAMSAIEFYAASRREAPAEVFFGYLRFEDKADYDAVGVERELLAAYAERVPGVLGLVGTELSLGPHVNQFGGDQERYPYAEGLTLDERTGDIRSSLVDFIHGNGGLASICHPAEPNEADLTVVTGAQAIARDLLEIGAGGADLLEVGYGRLGLVSLPDQLAVWDTLSRNGLVLTGNGVSDDHSGDAWARQRNRWFTRTWAGALDEPSLLDSLGSGRTFVGYLGSFTGTIDMTLDSDIPMGAVSVTPRTGRTLQLDVTGLPPRGAVEIVRGVVDYAGPGSPDPGTEVVATLGGTDLVTGSGLAIDTSEACFHRAQVVDADGQVVAFGQPIWTLEAPPPGGVPERRLAEG